jgi:hypothetical protein
VVGVIEREVGETWEDPGDLTSKTGLTTKIKWNRGLITFDSLNYWYFV